MFDIDPPAPILRLDTARPMGAAIKVDTSGLDSFAAQLDRYIAARVDRDARLAVLIDAAVSVGCKVVNVRKEGIGYVAELHFDADAAIARVRQLRIADGDLAYALDSAL